MYATDPHQVLWPVEFLKLFDVPEKAKTFLSEIGLPPFVADLSVEFGVYDTASERLMIGTDGEDRILVSPEGRVDVVKIEPSENERVLFLNSSVDTLSQFLYFVAELKAMPYENVESFRAKLRQLREHLRSIDRLALVDDNEHVWSIFLNDMDTMAF